MDRGTYASAALGLFELRKLEVVNNNLANVNTPGFKRQLLVSETQDFDQTLAKEVEREDPYARPDHERTPGTVNIETRVDFTPGPIRVTGNTLDVALSNPNDFFVVNTPKGPQYTRAGNFSLSQEGQLVTLDGYEVQGDGGAITVNGPSPKINPNGGVSVNGTQVGRLQVVRFEQPETLRAVGGTRFEPSEGTAAPTAVEAVVVPEALEMSNVSTVSSIVDLITTSRGFETYTRTAQTIDQMNQAAITQIGRAR